MCFPQPRALFNQLNFQKSDNDMFLAVWLRHVLRASSRHSGMQFLISHLTRWLRTRRFSEPNFWPSGATKHWKNTVSRDFSTFSCTWIFFLLTLSLLTSSLLTLSLLWLLSPLLFHLSILSEVWLLNFLQLRHQNKIDYITLYEMNLLNPIWERQMESGRLSTIDLPEYQPPISIPKIPSPAPCRMEVCHPSSRCR